ncbi:hypothetical protein [Porticoccus sp.]
MRQFTRKTLLLTVFLCAFTSIAQASITLPEDDAHNPYLIGKHTYHHKLACESCPLSDVVIDANKAREIIPRLQSEPQFTDILTPDEIEAVTFYLKTLFRLN